jgi:putative ABC transport system permease protein
MIFRIAWRNVWRNPVRSLTIVTAIALGLWAGVFMIGLSVGLSTQRKLDVISMGMGHIQIHHPGYPASKEIRYVIPNPESVGSFVNDHPLVKSVSSRIVFAGMVTSPRSAYGVLVNAVIPEQEKGVSVMYEKLTDGSYFPELKRNEAFMGESLAGKLKLRLNSKFVLTFQDSLGNITAGAFRIAGLYKTVSPKYDEANLYVKASDIESLMGVAGFRNEMVMTLHETSDADSLKNELTARFPGLLARTWKDLSPELRYMDEMMDSFLYIFVGIILFSLAFGLVNTMLMAVLERIRELGMLMAIGMNKIRVFMMIMTETLVLAFTGATFGLLLAYFTILYTGTYGLDLSFLEKGLAEFGIGSVIYPTLKGGNYIMLTLMVMAFAVLSSVYPALKALKLKPAEAIRKI